MDIEAEKKKHPPYISLVVAGGDLELEEEEEAEVEVAAAEEGANIEAGEVAPPLLWKEVAVCPTNNVLQKIRSIEDVSSSSSSVYFPKPPTKEKLIN